MSADAGQPDMRFTTRIIATVGLSTLLLTSLYWLVGWRYVEEAEEAYLGSMLEFIGSRADLVLQGQLPATALELVPGLRIHEDEASLPRAWAEYRSPGSYHLPGDGWLLRRPVPGASGSYTVYLPAVPELTEPAGSEQVEALLVVGGVMLFTLGAMGLTLLLVWKQTRPVRQLMQVVQQVDPAAPRLVPLDRQDEIGELSRQFAALLQRTEGFMQREQNFTRFASHELRSPLMAARSAVDLLQEMTAPEVPRLQLRALKRLEGALARMEQLVDSFLWLSREQAGQRQNVGHRELGSILQQLQLLHPELEARLVQEVADELCWSVHPFVLSVMLDTLLQNALQHGEGDVHLCATARALEVTNSVLLSSVARSNGNQHFGYGLPIIEQLSEKAGADFSHNCEAGWFKARICFAQPSE